MGRVPHAHPGTPAAPHLLVAFIAGRPARPRWGRCVQAPLCAGPRAAWSGEVGDTARVPFTSSRLPLRGVLPFMGHKLFLSKNPEQQILSPASGERPPRGCPLSRQRTSGISCMRGAAG